ncbi:sugar-binding domain-containing protein [Lactobacillus xujianguonis]|uniref:sugar-binding transcriptional regulator n=1 Tax=Lactobacillus TaxID=1578 RepID=UPI0026C81102
MAQLTNEELANIAHDYYLSKLNIAEISQKYSISRYLITKALDTAQEKGIVKISIQQQAKRNQDLEREFQHLFHLKEVIILQNHSTTNQDNEAIVSYAAEQIESYIKGSNKIGMTWGTLMLDIVNHFTPVERPDLTFVQLLGQIVNGDRRKQPIVQEAADKFNAQSRLLPAPLYVLHPKFLTALKKEPFYQTLEEEYDNLNLLFSGIGTFQSFKVNKYLNQDYGSELLQDIDQGKIAGMMFGRPYDINGHFFANFDDHLCGISLEALRKVPVRFVIVKNRFKVNALLVPCELA